SAGLFDPIFESHRQLTTQIWQSPSSGCRMNSSAKLKAPFSAKCLSLTHSRDSGGTGKFLCRPELATDESMDARRAAFRNRVPAELDIVGIEIPAGSRGWLLQDSIAARIVQKRVTGVARNAEVIAQPDLRGDRRCGAKLRI